MTHALRTSAGSHERFLVIEVFGRYAGFTALLPTMAGAANRCVIPEHVFDIEHLCELLTADRHTNPSRYSVVLVSEGATFKGMDEMVFEDHEIDAFGHKKLGGIGDRVSRALRDLSPKFNNGRRINVINQRLGYLVRCGNPDALDSIVPMAFGNLAMDLVLDGVGRAPRQRPQRPLRQRSDRRRHQPQEDRRRPQVLQHRPAAPDLRALRGQAAVHHDQRLLRRRGRWPVAGAGRDGGPWSVVRAGCAGRRPRSLDRVPRRRTAQRQAGRRSLGRVAAPPPLGLSQGARTPPHRSVAGGYLRTRAGQRNAGRDAAPPRLAGGLGGSRAAGVGRRWSGRGTPRPDRWSAIGGACQVP